MKMRAAVLEEFGAPLAVQEVELAEPRAGEVLVRLVACGVCHTDLYTASGADPSGYAPAVLGHEGAGVVEKVGPDVTSLAPGRPRRHPLLPPVRRVRPLRRPADQPLPGDPRGAEQGPPAGRHDPALPRRRGRAPLHGLLDLRRVHGDAGDRAGQGQPRGAARPRLPVRLRPLHRARRGDEHRRGGAGHHLRRLRRRHGRPRRRRRLPPAGRRADRLRRPLAERLELAARPGRHRPARGRRGRGRDDPRDDRRLRRRLHLRGDRQRRRDAPGGRGGADGLGPVHRRRGRRQGRDARHRPPLPDHRPPRRRLLLRRRQGPRPGARRWSTATWPGTSTSTRSSPTTSSWTKSTAASS